MNLKIGTFWQDEGNYIDQVDNVKKMNERVKIRVYE